jgi:hypothetical protein
VKSVSESIRVVIVAVCVEIFDSDAIILESGESLDERCTSGEYLEA